MFDEQLALVPEFVLKFCEEVETEEHADGLPNTVKERVVPPFGPPIAALEVAHPPVVGTGGLISALEDSLNLSFPPALAELLQELALTICGL